MTTVSALVLTLSVTRVKRERWTAGFLRSKINEVYGQVQEICEKATQIYRLYNAQAYLYDWYMYYALYDLNKPIFFNRLYIFINNMHILDSNLLSWPNT